MHEIVVAIIGMMGVGITTAGTVIVALRRGEDRLSNNADKNREAVEQKMENGLRSLIGEIHRDMQLSVLPTLVELKVWKNGYEGTPWADRAAIDEFINRVGSIEAAIGILGRDLAAVQRAIASHVEWEEQQKYEELEIMLKQMQADLDEHIQETASG